MKPKFLFISIALILLLVPVQAYADNLTVLGVGDVCFSGRLKAIGDKKGYDYYFSSFDKVIKNSDLSFLNLETCVSNLNNPDKRKKFVFRSSPNCLNAIKNAGFDGVSVANNHTLDHGKNGFIDTLNNLKKAGISYSGGGYSIKDAVKPAIFKTKGFEIAFLSFSDVVPPGFAATEKSPGISSAKQESRMMKVVQECSRNYDLTIVSIHWGKELSYYPTARQVRIAHNLVKNGADIVMGHHPHVVQPIEVYGGKVIIYSLGNFVFSPGSDSGRYTMLVKVSFTDTLKLANIQILPAKIVSGKPVPEGGKWVKNLEKILEKKNLDFKIFKNSLLYTSENKLADSLKPFIRFEKQYFET
ncbi:MAG: CapA family protein [Actinobacteria bacterium]|nr:CapA family protein [Actinomycetota bacterium]